MVRLRHFPDSARDMTCLSSLRSQAGQQLHAFSCKQMLRHPLLRTARRRHSWPRQGSRHGLADACPWGTPTRSRPCCPLWPIIRALPQTSSPRPLTPDLPSCTPRGTHSPKAVTASACELGTLQAPLRAQRAPSAHRSPGSLLVLGNGGARASRLLPLSCPARSLPPAHSARLTSLCPPPTHLDLARQTALQPWQNQRRHRIPPSELARASS